MRRRACRSKALPETGKIAVKVINHYGDEVLKVFRIQLAVTDWAHQDSNLEPLEL